MIFIENNKKPPVLLKDIKLGGYFKSNLVEGLFCRYTLDIYQDTNVFVVNTGQSEYWDTDQAVIPIEVTEVKFNYL